MAAATAADKTLRPLVARRVESGMFRNDLMTGYGRMLVLPLFYKLPTPLFVFVTSNMCLVNTLSGAASGAAPIFYIRGSPRQVLEIYFRYDHSFNGPKCRTADGSTLLVRSCEK